MAIRKQWGWTLALLIAVVAVFDLTPLDVLLQNHFYDAAATDVPPAQRWLIDKQNETLSFWFHRAIKNAVIVFGVGVLLLGISGFGWKRVAPYRRRLLFLACAMALVPVLVGGGKQITNTYCPSQTVLYGGDKPYVKLLEPYPESFHPPKKGRCFPAGHATTGFGLMALYFVFRTRRARLAGLAVGLTLGWVLGLFQMLRGEHFLSHTLFTMAASWLVILCTAALFRPRE